MALARVRLLDRFCFEYDDTPVVLPAALVRLVAFLALRGPSRRCVVAGTLWPDVSEEHALASLRTSIWRMNRLAPGLLSATSGSVAVSEAASVDSRDQEEFATGLLRGQLDDDGVVDGLSVLWGGALLPGWYDDWVLYEREKLEQRKVRALESLATTAYESGDLVTALDAAREASRREPLLDAMRSIAIRARLGLGDVSGAVHEYRAYRRFLALELGIEPSAVLVELEQRILSQDPQLLDAPGAAELLRGYRLGERLGSGRDGTVRGG